MPSPPVETTSGPIRLLGGWLTRVRAALEWDVPGSTRAHSSGGKSTSIATENLSEVTATPSLACTAACTKDGETTNADPLAAFVASLTAEQRRRLAALLTEQGEGGAS
jgi:hypothetical protein